MEDEALAELGTKYKDLQDRIKKLETRKSQIKTKLLAEMEERGTTGIVTGDVKITYVKQSSVVIDPDRLRRKLRAKWDSVTTAVLDKDKLAQEVMAGNITTAQVDACSTVVDKAPYPIVTVGG